MPLYLIERSFAEQLELTDDVVRLIEDVNADEGVRWLFSFLSADRRRSYCLYEAPSAEEIMVAARRANVPVDEIVEVDRFVPQPAALVDRAHHVSARWRRSAFRLVPDRGVDAVGRRVGEVGEQRAVAAPRRRAPAARAPPRRRSRTPARAGAEACRRGRSRPTRACAGSPPPSRRPRHRDPRRARSPSAVSRAALARRLLGRRSARRCRRRTRPESRSRTSPSAVVARRRRPSGMRGRRTARSSNARTFRCTSARAPASRRMRARTAR